MSNTTAVEPTTTTTVPPTPKNRQFVVAAAVETASRWTITTTNGISVSGYLPRWSACINPSEDGVEPNQLSDRLEDVNHIVWYPGQLVAGNLQGTPQGTGERSVGTTAILCPQINCDPFHEDPAKRSPYALVELIEGSDDWTTPLGPEGCTDLAAKLRAQADVLDQVAIDLAAARADWAQNGSQQVQA